MVVLPTYTKSLSFLANLSGVYDPLPGSGMATYAYKVDSAANSADLTFAPSVTCSLGSSAAQGRHTLTFQFKDHVANASSKITASTTYDNVAPTVTVSTPATNATFTTVTSTTITGTASDTTSGVATVTVTIQRSSDGLYWTGLGWQPTPCYLAATGTTNWTYTWTFDPAQQAGSPTYTIQATAMDTATNSGSSSTVTGVNVHNQFTLTYTAGSHGTISGTSPQTVAYGASGTGVTAMPDTGYHVVSWSDGVLSASRTDSNVTADLSVMANFASDRDNNLPHADAGPAQTVVENSLVQLDGSDSADPDGDQLTYLWAQTSGPTVTLSDAHAAQPTFTAPAAQATLTFQLVVSDGRAESSPASVTVTVVSGAANDLAVVGRYAFIADGADGLRIVDVGDPQAPTVVGHCDTPGMASDVSVCWPYAFVADGDAGLQVVDVSDPAHPAIVTSLQLAAAARRLCFSSGPILEDFESTSGFAVRGGTMARDTAHVKHGSASVKMTVPAGGDAELTRDNLGWDLSHERGALQLWVYAKSAPLGTSADPWNLGLEVVLSNDTHGDNYFTTVRNCHVHEGWNLLRFSTADWVATGSASWSKPIQRLQLSCPSPDPDRSAELSFDELRLGVRGVMPAFLWTFDDGYDEIYQDVLPYLSNLGEKGTMYLNTDRVDTGDGNISLAHLQGLYDAGWAIGNHTTDHTDLTAVDQATAAAKISACTTWLISHGFPRAAYHLAYPYNITNVTARAAAAQCGILTARCSGSLNQQLPVDDPLYLNSFSVSDVTPTIEAWSAKIDSAIASGGTLIIGCHDFMAGFENENLPLFRQIADYVAQRRLWTPTIDEWWNTLAMQAQAGEAGAGRWLYVACGDAGVQVVDISDPTAPVLMGRCATGGAEDVAAYDDGACVAAGGAGLQVVNALHPASPTLVGGLVGGPSPSQGVCVRGAKTYIAAGSDGLRIISTADPAHPVLLGTLDTPGDARDVTVVGTKAYVADGQAGIQVIDVSDPAHPVLVGTHVLAAAAEALVVFGHNAYVAVGDGGLQVVSLSASEV